MVLKKFWGDFRSKAMQGFQTMQKISLNKNLENLKYAIFVMRKNKQIC